MTMLFDRKERPRVEAVRRVKAWAEPIAATAEGDIIMVNELRCTEPGCPPVETVIAILRPGAAPRQIKIHKPVAEVTENDVRTAVSEDSAGHVHRPAE